MDILNGKLEDVLDRCRKNCYSSDQLKIIFSPLSTYLDHHTGCSKGPPLLYVLLTSILLCLGSAGLVMFWHEHLSGWGAFYYNAIAYGVISKDTLVRHFGHGCFLPNPYYERPAPFWPAPEDCHLCEATESVDTVNNVTFENVKVNYLDRGRPLIVTCAMDGWDSTRRSVDVEDVAELYLSAELSVTPPCYLDTNLNLRHALDMKEFVKIQRLISTSQLDKWFIQ
ncbi:uncharacterized protein LOC113467001, partial [Diaphorina citri]|uniref:Uncharacterized protein LOC113467001 n=1 Tax=Diaphorina citri TaxID=121845 RepID=A0A3Q0IQV1_DIACI